MTLCHRHLTHFPSPRDRKRLVVQALDVFQHPCFQFVLWFNSYLTEHGTCHLAEKHLCYVEPWSMGWSKYKVESPWPWWQVSHAHPRSVNTMIFQNNGDTVILRMTAIHEFKPFHKLHAPLSILNKWYYMAGNKIYLAISDSVPFLCNHDSWTHIHVFHFVAYQDRDCL